MAAAVVGARAHDLRRARPRHPGDRARHAAVLQGDVRDARPPRRALRAEVDPARGDLRRGATRARGAQPLGARARSLLSHQEGRAARARACAVRRVGDGHQARAGPDARERAARGMGRTLRRLEGPAARRLGREACAGVHPCERDSIEPAARRRVSVDRLHSVHTAGAGRRGRTRGALDRRRQDRVRHTPQSRRPMTDDQKHIYAHEHPESERRRDGGFTLWFTGLSGSGKTTIAHIVGPELERRGHIVEYLDGDTVRTNLSKGLGFSKEDRDTNIERIGWVAARLTRHGAAVIAAAISPYEETRQKARSMVEEWGPFVEVHVATSVEECARRDVKGLYEKAFAGEIKGFTGVDDPYEEPASPELVVNTEEHEPEESARLILAKLEELGLVAAAEVAA